MDRLLLSRELAIITIIVKRISWLDINWGELEIYWRKHIVTKRFSLFVRWRIIVNHAVCNTITIIIDAVKVIINTAEVIIICTFYWSWITSPTISKALQSSHLERESIILSNLSIVTLYWRNFLYILAIIR